MTTGRTSLLKGSFNILASRCSWGDWFESCLDGNPEDSFSRDEAHMVCFLPFLQVPTVVFHVPPVSQAMVTSPNKV